MTSAATPLAHFVMGISGIVDTGGKFATGVNNTRGKFVTSVHVETMSVWKQYQTAYILK
jgi:hypothetical protein